MPHSISRRLVLRLSAASAAVAVAGCSAQSGPVCATSKTLTTGQKAARDGRAYVEKSGQAGKSCENCEFFQAAGEGCGACAIDSLPANPKGYCNSWSAQQASVQPQSADMRRQG